MKSGDTFKYLYTYKSTVTIGTTTTVAANFQSNETATLSGPANFNGVPAYTLRTTGTSTNGKASLDYDDFVNLIASGGHTKYVEYGYNYADQVNYGAGVTEHDSTIITYASPFIYDTLPETSGSSWTEPVGVVETIDDYDQTSQNNPNILSGTLTRASDGSYHGSGMNYDVPETRVLKSNGTGDVVDGPASGATDWSYGIPQAAATGHVIPATESYAGQSDTNLVPDWYPGGNLPASPLAAESMRDLGKQKAPSTCGTRAGTLATHLESTFTQLDPIEGFTNKEVQDLYVVPGLGYICKLDSVVQQNYDTENTGKLKSTKNTQSAQILTSEILK